MVALDVEDRLDLQELSARYAHAFDQADADAFVALFAEGAVFTLPDGTRIEGADRLRTLVGAASQRAPRMRHLITNVVIDETPAGARGLAYFYCVRLGQDGTFRLLNVGRYEDEFTKTADGWRFASRRVVGELALELVDAPITFGSSSS
jgi:3-phenylpropionate/cinnamic acid dioxygenase small subunit